MLRALSAPSLVLTAILCYLFENERFQGLPLFENKRFQTLPIRDMIKERQAEILAEKAVGEI